MPEPLVVTRAREFKAALLRREEAQMAEMVRRWRGVEVALQAQIENMAQFAATEAAAGRALTQQALLTMDRYQSLLRQTNAEIGRYGAWAERAITSEQASLAALGLTQATELVGISAEAAQIAGTFSRLPVQAVEQMVGLAGDGTPLRNLLAQAWPDAVAGLTDELVTGIALGRNPRVIARLMVEKGLATGLQRAMTIARTEQLRAYRQASQMQYRASRVVKSYKRISAHDSRVCIGCLVQDGVEYSLEVEFEAHPQCVVGGTIVSAPPIRAVTKRFYDGPVFDMVTVSGNRLTVTPNHPILTDKGWIAAGLLKVGDNVISGAQGDRTTILVTPNNQQGPARIEDIVTAFSESGNVSPVSVPVSSVDFHGDGMGSDVAVVWTNRLLRNGRQPAVSQPLSEQAFGIGDVGLIPFPAHCTIAEGLERTLAPSDGILGNANAAQVFGLGSLGSEQLVGFGLTTDFDASLNQAATDAVSVNAVGLGESVLGLTSDIAGGDLTYREFDVPEIPVNSPTLQMPIQGRPADAMLVKNNAWFNSGNVITDRIVEFGSRHFSGHVYNLETETGWYVANGIITHNCRCALIPILAGANNVTWESGEAWLNAQSEKTQLAIMGPQRLELWKSGRVKWADMATVKENSTWGNSIVPTPVRELIKS